MKSEEVEKRLGKLRFGDEEQIRIKKLLEEIGSAEGPSDRIGTWLRDSLLRLGACPPEALSAWAEGMAAGERHEARRMVDALRALVLAMEMFLEEADRPGRS
ncbi:MAG: hypothetical protein U0166_24415 [Acidobacteriota bacterium]